MKKNAFFGLLVILLFVGFICCDNGNGNTGEVYTSGRLTINGIPSEYNGMFVGVEGGIAIGKSTLDEFIQIYDDWEGNDYNQFQPIVGLSSFNNNNFSGKFGKINNGTVILNIYRINENYQLGNFNKSGIAIFELLIFATEDFPLEEPIFILEEAMNVTFINGIATGTYN